MTDTPQTPAQLLNTFRDGQAPRSIPEAAFRNWQVSTPDFNIISAPFRPDSAAYGAKFDGTTDDTAAWTAMFADITTKGWGEVILPNGTSIVQGGQLKMPNQLTMTGKGRYGSVIQRKLNSTGIMLDTAGTSDTVRSTAVCLRDFGVVGDANTSAGIGIRWLYASECHTENLRLFNFLDNGWQIVAGWDSSWYNNFLNWCGLGGQPSSGGTIGQSAVLLSGGTTTSGIGASAWGCNNLNFYSTRIETFAAEGIAIQQNHGTNTSGLNSQLRFYGTKLETHILGTNNLNSLMVNIGADARNIQFDRSYLAFDAGVGSNIGFFTIVQFYGNENNTFRNTEVWIGTASQVSTVFGCFTNGASYGNHLGEITIDGTTGQLFGLNGGAVIQIQGASNIPYTSIACNTGSAGALVSPAYPPGIPTNQTTQSITAVGQTIAVGLNNSTVITTTTGASMTGMIMAAGTSAGQVFTIINTTAFTIVFAASGTSHVFGTPTQAANVAQDYIWDGTNSLWRQIA